MCTNQSRIVGQGSGLAGSRSGVRTQAAWSPWRGGSGDFGGIGFVQERPTTHRNNGYAVRPGRRRDPSRGLAEERLPVERPLARDDQRRPAQHVIKANQVQDDLDAVPHLGAEHRERGIPDTTCRTGPRHLGVIAAHRLGDQGRKVPKSRLQGSLLKNASPLLRGKDCDRTSFSQKRIGHITRERQRHLSQPRMQARQVNRRKVCERSPTVRQLRTLSVEEPRPKRRQHPRPTVGTRTPANAQDDLAHPWLGFER